MAENVAEAVVAWLNENYEAIVRMCEESGIPKPPPKGLPKPPPT